MMAVWALLPPMGMLEDEGEYVSIATLESNASFRREVSLLSIGVAPLSCNEFLQMMDNNMNAMQKMRKSFHETHDLIYLESEEYHY